MCYQDNEMGLSELKVDFNQLKWTFTKPFVQQKQIEFKGNQIRLVRFLKGFEEMDWCCKEHFGYVMKGEFTVDFNGELLTFKENDVIAIPKGMQHKLILPNE